MAEKHGIVWDHLHLRTPDVGATALWFKQMLGADIVELPHLTTIKLGGVNIFLAKVNEGDGVNPPPSPPYQGLDHFGLSVVGIDALAAELKAKGAVFTKGPLTLRPGLRVCFIQGPQGISIELLERNPIYE